MKRKHFKFQFLFWKGSPEKYEKLRDEEERREVIYLTQQKNKYINCLAICINEEDALDLLNEGFTKTTVGTLDRFLALTGTEVIK